MTGLLQPWRSPGRLWRSLAHVTLDLPFGVVSFTLVFTLLALTIGLLVTFPLAVVTGSILMVASKGLAAIERSRVAALLGVELSPDPEPARAGSWWSKTLRMATSRRRWKEVAYHLVLLPLGAVTFATAVVVWCGSAVLIGLPLYVAALPGAHAQFGLFAVGVGGVAIAAAVIGAAGLLVVAPWTTLGLAALDAAVARGLLGSSPRHQLDRRVTQLEASRVAAVDSAETERRRIERDLHDGAQQRLVALAVDLGRARERFDTNPDVARELVIGAHEEAKAALGDLRDLVRGFHPAILAEQGLDAALSAVVARSPVPVRLDVDVAERPAAAIESTAYFVVTEALANVAKHARATSAAVTIVRHDLRLVVEVTDNGVGGADPALGSGLSGLAERVQAIGGWIRVLSPSGGPTTVLAELPCGS